MSIDSSAGGADAGEAKSDFDAVALREKYRQERNRRIRPDAISQYVETAGDFTRYVDDPYAESHVERQPLRDEVEVLVIGGGFGGLIAAARLRQAGIEDIRILEKGSDFGGAWYWNRYPGAQCDVEAYIYLPLLEETNYIPTEKYTYAGEIREHAQRIAKTFDLYRAALFQTEVQNITWLDDEQRWRVYTNRDDSIMARFVVMSSGPLNRPKLPGIPGIETFKGHSFHTSRWDYAYTGGGPDGGLDKLADKRVAIIGTGATAVQCVPHLGRSAKQLYVFQRTPSSVDLRRNRPTDPEWAKALRPGWHKHRMDNFNGLVSGVPQDEDLVSDGWTDIIRNLSAMASRRTGELSAEGVAHLTEMADFRKMNEIRARVDAVVEDPKTAEALKPWYRQFCKRPCFNDDYLPTFNRPNVTLVDTLGRGVDRITERGLVFDEAEYEVDCLIFATGFEVGTAYTRRSGFEIHGRDGKTLTEYWGQGLKTLHGFYSHGFPNCFHMGITQNVATPNFPHMLDEQATHIAEVILRTRLRQVPVVEPTADAEAEWVGIIQGGAARNTKFAAECTPGYYNGEGAGGGLFDGLYAQGSIAFFQLIKAWRANGRMEGLEVE
jgi:cation diffusion facilitator CzcD-associated flavoprotein CzcO